MPKALITGVAGFIGSHLAERLIREGFEVIGIDSLEDYYPVWIKQKNIQTLQKSPYLRPHFTFIQANLLSDNLSILSSLISHLKDVDYIFHQAAQAGVRRSWGKDFQIYTNNNILATQRLLEVARNLPIKKFIYASSSSVYGEKGNLPLKEDSPTVPLSPYGVSKLAGENLCYLYWKNFSIPTVSLRYFTVYGPRQRPDMAFHKFIKATLTGEKICIFGDGTQTRDFTYIDDVIQANILSLNSPPGKVFNIGGGSRVPLMDTVQLIQNLCGKKANIEKKSTQKGDVKDTWADIARAKNTINYSPTFSLKEGLQKQIIWTKELYS